MTWRPLPDRQRGQPKGLWLLDAEPLSRGPWAEPAHTSAVWAPRPQGARWKFTESLLFPPHTRGPALNCAPSRRAREPDMGTPGTGEGRVRQAGLRGVRGGRGGLDSRTEREVAFGPGGVGATQARALWGGCLQPEGPGGPEVGPGQLRGAWEQGVGSPRGPRGAGGGCEGRRVQFSFLNSRSGLKEEDAF